MHDLAIRNVQICDGSGDKTYRGELAVTDGRISAITKNGESVGEARDSVDAANLVLTPGLIDNHTHYDAQITWDAFASPSTTLGVTTLIMGNCGFTIAPCKTADREQTFKNLTQVEGMSLDALTEGTSRDYETFDEYMGLLESLGTVPNVAVYCGHSSVRTWVMGDAAVERTANDQEIKEMKSVIASCLDSGAIGFSTSTYQGHNGWGGVPMPSRFADENELRQLVGTLGEKERGIFMLTKGNSTPVPMLETLAADTDRPVAVAAVLYDHANPQSAKSDMDAIDAAVDRGRKMFAQVACTPISMDFTLRGAYLFEGCAAWKPAISLYDSPAELGKFFDQPDFRAAMKSELVSPEALNRFTDQWDKVEIVKAANASNEHLEGQIIADLARADSKDPFDWMLDFAATEDFATMFNASIVNADESGVAPLLQSDNSTIGLADAGAHMFLFCDADFGLHLLSRWVRDLGTFTFEKAIAELTSKQARAYGIRDRGELKVGYHADMLLLDPDAIGRGRKQRNYDMPAGASRLVRTEASGIAGMWINGSRVMNAGEMVDESARPGTVLRDFDVS